MRIVSIYGLVNPLNNKVFYVGATESSLKVRLSQHIRMLKRKSPYKTGGCNERKILFDSISDKGLVPTIKLLEECSLKHANERENYWFRKYEKQVLQTKTGSFRQQLNRSRVKKIKFALVLTRKDYNKAIKRASGSSTNLSKILRSVVTAYGNGFDIGFQSDELEIVKSNH